MPKLFVCSIGYKHFACGYENMGKLLEVVAGLREVKQKGYTGPYFFVPEDEAEDASILGAIELRECKEPEPPPPPPGPLQITHQPLALASDTDNSDNYDPTESPF